MSKETKIWVLGGKAENADKCISWQENLPNLSNTDILLIDLNTIPQQMSIPLYEMRDYLRRVMMAGKRVYVILPMSEIKNHNVFDAFPVFPKLVYIKPCDYDYVEHNCKEDFFNELFEYSKYVESCSFFVNGLYTRYLWDYLNPNNNWNQERYPFSESIASMTYSNLMKILNVSNQLIGVTTKFLLYDSHNNLLHQTGAITFLPPPTKITSTEAIEVLVNSIVGVEIKENEPEWSKKIEMPLVKKLIEQVSAENRIIEASTKNIKGLNLEKMEIEKHKKLLWTFNITLENAVRDALLLLGFQEVRQGRSKELEDLVIDFKTNKEYIHGIIEVKGREGKTSLADMNQSDKWVKQYRVQENKKVKGIFLSNQFRRTEEPESKLRLKFEPNEIEFAKDFNLCVLPSVELFKAVVAVLNGKKIPRELIEKRILEASPICKIVD